MDILLGQWKYDVTRSPGLLEFLSLSGIPKEVCTDEKVGDLKVSVTREGDSFTWAMDVPGHPVIETKHTPGKSFEFTNPSGMKFKTSVKAESGKVIETMVEEATGLEIKTEREVTGSDMKTVSSINGKTYTLYLVRI